MESFMQVKMREISFIFYIIGMFIIGWLLVRVVTGFIFQMVTKQERADWPTGLKVLSWILSILGGITATGGLLYYFFIY